MEEMRHDARNRFGGHLGIIQVARVSKDNCTLLIISNEGTLRRGLGHMIQCRIEAQHDQDQAGHEDGKSEEKSFHAGI